MTTADAVRGRLGLGRLLPLGGPEDGAWLTERAADGVLRRAAAGIAGAELGKVRLALVDPEGAGSPAVPPPPSALPPGPLAIEAEFTATAERPLPVVADALREALFSAATAFLELSVERVDLRVTALVDSLTNDPGAATAIAPEAPADAAPTDTAGGTGGTSETGEATPAVRAAASAPGVARLTSTLGAPVRLASDHVRVEVAIAPGSRPLAVARAVRTAVSAVLEDDRPVSVLVTDVPG
ncbi:hypothetical protein [Streptomyces sp. NPDC020141]|uniref:hypothetical protein n=1 Tax=Streptomyces sp. NPDC020141 TaxID=3365065 RepID=UPI003787F6A5